MTGHIGFSSSYKNKLQYCLHDKRIRQRQNQHPAQSEHRQTINRAEVLYYHQCYGNTLQLTKQFKEVQKQNLNVINPVFHLSLSLPPEEKISKSRFVDIAKDCARALDFAQHQYVVILHKDTAHSHIHLVVNRIGLDTHVLDGRNKLKQMDQFCREAEQKYELTRVQSIRRYRSAEERSEPNRGQRIVQLREQIALTLEQTRNLPSFSAEMHERGYRVYKTERGISFKDEDGVFTTGARADYPWKKIEAALAENLTLRQIQEQRLEQERIRQEEPKQKQVLRQKQVLEREPEHELVQRRGLRMRM
jgi:Relaxase/Mobilisation nuclease domain